jgi:methyl-accepting chemotaxis protein
VRNWTINGRIWAVLSLAALVGISSGGFLFFRLESVVAGYERLFTRDVRDQDLARQMQVAFKKEVQEWKDLLLRGRDPALFAKYSAAFQKESEEVRRLAAELQSSVDNREARSILDRFVQADQAMAASYGPALQVFAQSKGMEQAKVDAMVKGQDRPPTDLIDSLVRTLIADTGQRRAAIVNNLWRFGCSVALAFLALGMFTVVVVRGIHRDLRINVVELRNSARTTAATAQQVAAAGQGLAQGACEQAASLEETAASAEQTASLILRNAESATASAKLMAEVKSHINGANQVLIPMLEAMDNVKRSSGKIVKIIKVIDEIAFQTNILALNAAVEAARAGPAGAGFAVVADEVRNLAQRSAQAAKDTEALIQESMEVSNGGHGQAGEIADAIRSITSSAETVHRLVEEVSQGSQEQSRGMEAISSSLQQIDQVTQRSAAAAEESAAAGDELQTQAATLNQVVARLSVMLGAAR